MPPIHHGRAQALALLFEAYEAAQQTELDLWQFAIEAENFFAQGISGSILRCLLVEGHIYHGVETTPIQSRKRRFRRIANLQIPARTCFVLTESGRELVRQNSALQAVLAGDRPHGDGEHRILMSQGIVVKRFERLAINQMAVLTTFEQQGWPPQIEDPPLPGPAGHYKKRLHDAIKDLNHRQDHRLLHFAGDGTGRGVCWERL
jgi:signal transduction histidine kinase